MVILMAQPIPNKLGRLRLEYLLAFLGALFLLPTWFGPFLVTYQYQSWCASIPGCQRLVPTNRIEAVEGGAYFRQHLIMYADLRTLTKFYGTKDQAIGALRLQADRQYPDWQKTWLRVASPAVEVKPATKGKTQS